MKDINIKKRIKPIIWGTVLRLAVILPLVPVSLVFAKEPKMPIPNWYHTPPTAPYGKSYCYVPVVIFASSETEDVSERGEREARERAISAAGYKIKGSNIDYVLTHAMKLKVVCKAPIRERGGRYRIYLLYRIPTDNSDASKSYYWNDPVDNICGNWGEKAMEYNHYTAERDEREHIETTQGPEIEKRKYETRWVSAGAGFGYLPNDTAGAYSGAAPGLYGLYLSGRYGGTWGMSPYTWGVGIIGGAGQGSRGFHVGGGVSVYPINDFFLQALYGTSVYSYVIPGYSDNWRYVSPKTVVEDGYTVLAGHDFHLRSIEVPGGHIMFSLACGATKVESQKWQPAYSVSVGYALQYWKN